MSWSKLYEWHRTVLLVLASMAVGSQGTAALHNIGAMPLLWKDRGKLQYIEHHQQPGPRTAPAGCTKDPEG